MPKTKKDDIGRGDEYTGYNAENGYYYTDADTDQHRKARVIFEKLEEAGLQWEILFNGANITKDN